MTECDPCWSDDSPYGEVTRDTYRINDEHGLVRLDRVGNKVLVTMTRDGRSMQFTLIGEDVAELATWAEVAAEDITEAEGNFSF